MKKILIAVFLMVVAKTLFADEWRLQPGTARDIAVGANGAVWSIGTVPTAGSFNIQFWNGTAWQNVDGGGTRIAVDPSGNPWVINNANQIFKRQAGRWIRMPGAAIDIGIGADGSIWVIGMGTVPGGNSIHFWNGTAWQMVGGGGTRISVAPNGQPFVVNSNGNIFERQRTGEWIPYPGQAFDISVGANGTICVIGRIARPGGGFSIHKWSGSEWQEYDGGGNQIAVGAAGRPWVVNLSGQIYYRTSTPLVYNPNPTVQTINMNYPVAGRISAIAQNPIDHNHMIVAGESGGLFETLNAGVNSPRVRTWRHIDNFNHHAVTDILINNIATGGHEIWVTIVDSYQSGNTPQIWKRDASGTWSRSVLNTSSISEFTKSDAYRIVKDKVNGTLYACGEFGLAYKTEFSTGWTLKRPPFDWRIISIETLMDGSLVAYTANGIATLENPTSSWRTSSGISIFPVAAGYNQQRFSLKADPLGRIVFLSKMRADGRGVDVFASSNSGRDWSLIPNVCGRDRVSGGLVGGYESILPIYDDATDRLTIFISNGENVHYGTATGTTIEEALSNMLTSTSFNWSPGAAYNSGYGFNWGHEDTRQVALLRTNVATPKMVITSDGGFHIAPISGLNFEGFSFETENTNSGLNALQIYNLTGTSNEFYFGTQDNAFGYNNDGRLQNWSSGGGREGIIIEKRGNGNYDNIILKGILPRLLKNRNAFEGVTECPSPIQPTIWNSPAVDFGIPVSFSKDVYIQNSNRSPTTGFDWKITFNKGCSWNYIASSYRERSGERAYFSQSSNQAISLSACFDVAGKVVLGKLDDALNTRSPGRYWSYALMSGLTEGIDVVGANFLYNPVYCVNPENGFHAFAAEKGTGKLKKTTNGGGSWDEVTSFTSVYTDGGNGVSISSEGTSSIWNIEYSPYDPNFILLGTVSRGLYYSRDAGNTWTRVNAEGVFMPADFHWKSEREIIIATYSRGLFRMNL